MVVTVLVLWFAHVYAHGLGESIHAHRRLDRQEMIDVAHRELSIPLAAVGPTAALVLGAVGVLDESRSIWIADGICLAILAAQGLRYARLEDMGRGETAVAVALNLGLGVAIVVLEVIVAH